MTKNLELSRLVAALALTVACAPASNTNYTSADEDSGIGEEDGDSEEDSGEGEASDGSEESSESEGEASEEASGEGEESEAESEGEASEAEASTTEGGEEESTTSTSGEEAEEEEVTTEEEDDTASDVDPTSTESDTAGDIDSQEIDAANMIDDFADGNSAIIDEGGRSGYWYSGNDGTDGEQSPAEDESELLVQDGGPAEDHKLVYSGSGFSDWGSYVGVALDDSGGAYSLADFTGVAFLARGSGDAHFKVNTTDVTDSAGGGTCVANADEGIGCNIGHEFLIELTDEWTQFVVPFAMLEQPEWGNASDFDPANVLSLQWSFDADVTFELQLDEVGLY